MNWVKTKSFAFSFHTYTAYLYPTGSSGSHHPYQEQDYWPNWSKSPRPGTKSDYQAQLHKTANAANQCNAIRNSVWLTLLGLTFLVHFFRCVCHSALNLFWASLPKTCLQVLEWIHGCTHISATVNSFKISTRSLQM